MRRRAPNEKIEPYRRRLHASEGNALRDQLAAWAITQGAIDAAPEMPVGIADRDADVWEALLAVADAAGANWSVRARVAAVALVALAKVGTPSLGVRLLTDLRKIFVERDVMATEEIIESLLKIEEAPWTDLKGKPLDARRLAGLLRQYGIASKTVRIGERTPRGICGGDLFDPYVPVAVGNTSIGLKVGMSGVESATSATPAKKSEPTEHDLGMLSMKGVASVTPNTSADSDTYKWAPPISWKHCAPKG